MSDDGSPDVVGLDLWTPDGKLLAALRVDRRSGPAAFVATAGAEMTRAHGPAVDVGDHSARVETDEVRLECKLRTLTPPVDTSAAGLRRHVELCGIEGSVAVGGRSTPLQALGVRTHTWGEHAATRRRRFVTAATAEGSLVSLVAVRPDAATTHGDEVVVGHVVDPQSDNGAMPFEEVRLSTIYGPDGLPRTAGAELYRPGAELPARLSGESISGAALELDGTVLTISFFRWTLLGRPAWGTYELEPAG